MAVFWDAPYSLVETNRRISGDYSLYYQGYHSTCEASVDFYQTTERNIPDDSHLHNCRC